MKTSTVKILKLIIINIILLIGVPTTVSAADYYLSPNGNDTNSGTSTSLPWKTFNRAWQSLFPGDRLLLMDGTYYDTLSPNVRDGSPNPSINNQDYITYPLDHPERIKNYITVKALNDGKAIIDGQYQRVPVSLGYYTHNWKGNYFLIEGIVAKNSSVSVYIISGKNIIIRRSSGYNSNTHINSGVFTAHSGGSNTNPANILLEDNFASGLGRKMFMAYGTYVNVIFRRNAAYTVEVPIQDQGCMNDWPNGDSIEIYNWNQQDLPNNSIVENNIALGGTPTYNFSLTPNPARTIGNKFLGNISIQNGFKLDGSYRVWRCEDMAAACIAHGTACAVDGSSNWMGHRTGFTFGAYGKPLFKNNTFQDLFAYGNASWGLHAGPNWCTGTEEVGNYPCARCNKIENNAAENCQPGELSQSDRSSGNILNRITLINNSIGTASPYNSNGAETSSQALNTFATYGTVGSLFIEGNTQYQDKSKGARLRYRYINGVLMDGTNGQPAQELWPWPMEERIKTELAREFGIQNYSITNSIVPLLNLHTAVQVPLGNYSSPPPTPTPTSPTPLLGDINKDGIVNLQDFVLLSNYFGTNNSAADINKDGIVNLQDYVILSNNFGKSA